MMLNVSHTEYRGQIKVVFLGDLPNLDPCTSRYGSRMVQKSNVSDLAWKTSILRFRFVPAPYAEQGQHWAHAVALRSMHSQIYCRSMNMTTVVPNMSSHARQRYYRFWKTVLQIELTFYCPSLSLAKKEQSGFSFPKVPILHFFSTLTRRVGCFLWSGTTRFDLFEVIRHIRVDSPLTRKHLKNRGRTACPMLSCSFYPWLGWGLSLCPSG